MSAGYNGLPAYYFESSDPLTPNLGLSLKGMDPVVAANFVILDSGSGGSSVQINGSVITNPNFNNTTPAAPSGSLNVTWQVDGSGNVSAYVLNPLQRPVVTKTASYLATASDGGTTFIFNVASVAVLTLPATAPANGWYIRALVYGGGTLVINPNGRLLDGASSSQTLPTSAGNAVFSDGTNYALDCGSVGLGSINQFAFYSVQNGVTGNARTSENGSIFTYSGTGGINASGSGAVINANTGYQIAGAATSGNFLRGNGTNFVSSAIQAGDVLWSSLGNANANLTLSNAAFTTEFDQTSNVAWLWANTTTATVATVNASPLHEFAANYWTGSASAQDLWTIGTAMTAGASAFSTLTVQHPSGASNAGIALHSSIASGNHTGIVLDNGTASFAPTTGTVNGVGISHSVSTASGNSNFTSLGITTTFNGSPGIPTGTITALKITLVGDQLYSTGGINALTIAGDAGTIFNVAGDGSVGSPTLSISSGSTFFITSGCALAFSSGSQLSDNNNTAGGANQVLTAGTGGQVVWKSLSALSGLLWNNLGNASGALTLANGTNATTFNQTSNVAWLWANTTTATVSTTNASPTHQWAANYWTGAASAQDTWTAGSSLAAGTNGASTLAFTQSGSSGAAKVQVPILNAITGIQINGAATSGNYLRGNGTNFVAATIAAGDVLWNNLGNASGSLTLSNGANATTFNQTSAVAWMWANTTTATSGTTNASPLLELLANYWTGSASAQDLWSVQSSLAAGTNGTSTLTFSHSGTTGTANYNLNCGTNSTFTLTPASGATFQILMGTTSNQLGPTTGNALLVLKGNTSSTAQAAAQVGNNANLAATSGAQYGFEIGDLSTGAATSINFAPTSGTATFGVLAVRPVINQTGGANGTVTDIMVNSKETAVVGTHNFLDLQAGSSGTTSRLTINNSGIITNYNTETTAAVGVAYIRGSVSQTSSTGAATILSVTPPAVAGSYRLRFTAAVSTATTLVGWGWTATWTDSNGSAQAPTNLSLFQSGTAAPALTFAATGNYYGEAIIDVNNGGTAIVIKVTLTSGTLASKVSATIERLI